MPNPINNDHILSYQNPIFLGGRDWIRKELGMGGDQGQNRLSEI